jgi:hypothetical protein
LPLGVAVEGNCLVNGKLLQATVMMWLDIKRLNGYLLDISVQILCESAQGKGYKGYKGYKDGLQPESLADGNWLVKQN